MDNTLVCTFVFLVSISNVEILTILDSRIFNMRQFSMIWLETTHLKVRTFGLAGNLLDNIPQLIIQGFFVAQNGVTGIAIASMIASGLSLLFGIMRKLLLFIVLQFAPEHKNPRATSFASTAEQPDDIKML